MFISTTNQELPHIVETPEQIHLQKDVKSRTYKKSNPIKVSLDKVAKITYFANKPVTAI